ncbi:hypothetical protein EDD18DRAFT_1433089 [Armillaria luteobubalina]|uniref:Uncharacterized protein n=1 Tax=Armillaria luteobubalina TaxID=153913 RepID=A0AA39TE27_9AGAR|nr:hypothetical protein EDD18DRAFT_1433089 [Armillaria luteobubalina]
MSMKQLILILAILLYYIPPVLNAPLPSDDSDCSPSATGNRRLFLSIPWSCLVTIVACTWLSVHPDVPGRKISNGHWGAMFLERAKLMGIAVLAPELIVAWAAGQLFIAWKVYCLDKPDISIRSHMKQKICHLWEQIRHVCEKIHHCCCYLWKSKDQSKDQNIALDAHRDTDERKLTMTHGFFLSMGGFCEERTGKILVQEDLEGNDDLIRDLVQTNESIQDKSKADAFSKTVSMLQIAWFITQCIARVNQHLPVTLLEVTALAFAVSSIIASLLWLYKPFNVRYHIEVKTGRSPLDPGRWGRKFDGGIPQFATMTDDSEDAEDLRMAAVVAAGLLFGAIHCAAWSSSFPSYAEKMLWRFSSVAVVVALVVYGFMPWIYSLPTLTPEGRSAISKTRLLLVDSIKGGIQKFTEVMFRPLVIAYIAARIILIVLAFMQLRSLPPLSLDTVQWTTYIPHI